MKQLTVTEKHGGNYILFELNGAFNAYTDINIKSKIYDNIQKTNVALDLSKVIELDSSAMGIITAAHNDALTCGTKLYLVSISNEAEKEIISTGFKNLFNIINSVTEIN